MIMMTTVMMKGNVLLKIEIAKIEIVMIKKMMLIMVAATMVMIKKKS